jgi:uncharacterized delta-60 repeat protein
MRGCRYRRLAGLLLLGLPLVAGASPARAMDTSFATGATAMTLQPNGRIVLAGHLYNRRRDKGFAAIARYRSNGRLDRGFGRGGVVLEPRGVKFGAVGIAAKGRIVVGGWGYPDFQVTRRMPDGSRDLSFGHRGLAGGKRSHVITGSIANALAILPSGEIVVAGTYCQCGRDQPQTETGSVERFSPDGRLAKGGKISVEPGAAGLPPFSYDSQVNDLLTAPDGAPTVAGSVAISASFGSPRWPRLMLARFDAAGQPDLSFGGGAGSVITDLDPASSLPQVASSIVAAGTDLLVAGKADGEFALARYRIDGSLDPGFGQGGALLTNAGGGRKASGANAAAVEPDGRIVVAGSSARRCARCSQIALARYLPDGRLDPSFGGGGVVRTRLPLVGRAGAAQANALALLPDGKVLVAGGLVTEAVTERFVLLRYEADGSLDHSFGARGAVLTSLPR